MFEFGGMQVYQCDFYWHAKCSLSCGDHGHKQLVLNSFGPNDNWLHDISVQLFVLLKNSYSRSYSPKSDNPHLLRNFFGLCKPPSASPIGHSSTVSCSRLRLLQCLTACFPWHLDLP